MVGLFTSEPSRGNIAAKYRRKPSRFGVKIKEVFCDIWLRYFLVTLCDITNKISHEKISLQKTLDRTSLSNKN
jgi:hypothetical protein